MVQPRYHPTLLLLATAVALTACTDRKRPPSAPEGAATSAQSDTANQPRGLKLDPPKRLPEIALTDTDGKRFDLRKEMAGYVTLLFFGYTHCPDVCPVHMANIARALKSMRAPEASRIKVVFVTTDPERDTPKRIRHWLDTFDPVFIGLRGTPEEIASAERAARLPPSMKETADSTKPAEYTVGHAAFVFAATSDGMVRHLYPFGFRQADWAHDLPLLIRLPPIAITDSGSIIVSRAFAFAPASTSEAAAYFTAENRGTLVDTLVAISTPEARETHVHAQARNGDEVRMQALDRIAIEPGDSLVLEPGGAHLMLVGLTRKPAPGDTVRVTLRFARSGEVTLVVPVRAYGDAE